MRRTGAIGFRLGTTVLAALVVSACGGGKERAAPAPPRLPAPLATQLASRSDEVARLLESRDGCSALAAARLLQQEAITAINSRRIPARLQEPLLTAANDLTVRIRCVPQQPPPEEVGDEAKEGKHGNGKGNDKGKGEGKGHGKGKRGHGGGDD